MNREAYKLTFAGFLAVRLMEFDYGGKHYSYHGRKLEGALKRLLARPFSGKNCSTAELVIHGQAVYDWRRTQQESEK